MKKQKPPHVDADGNWQHGKKWMPAMYVAYFGILQDIAQEHGYALCIHGSVVRDFDLVLVPFDVKVSSHEVVLDAFRSAIGTPEHPETLFDKVGHEPHGRLCYTIEVGGGGYLDISFTPTMERAIELVKKEQKQRLEMNQLLESIQQATVNP